MAIQQRDYYEVLNVARTADGDTIKRSYRKLAMKYHPDRNPGDTQAEQNFKEASQAYEVLSDPDKRQRYDRYGHEGLRGTSGHDFSNMDASDIFSMFGFGDALEQMFGGGRRSGPSRGYSLETQTEITLEEVATGVDRTIEFTRRDHCPTCSGNGAKPGTKPTQCVTCGGAGKIQRGGGMFRMITTCPACQGQGQVYKEKCSTCKGSGQQPKKRVLSVKIPAGIHDGQAIRVADEGEPGPQGGQRGDLHVVVHVKEHTLFSREDDHLILKMPISFSQAALGATISVPTLEGEEEVTIKPGTQHGQILQIHGKGLPDLRTGQKGDLAIVVLIEVPTKLTEEQTKLLRDFAATEDAQVMPESRGFWKRIKEYLH